ncbi:hypothetical protein NXC12_PD00089 (plasmid) [Rhizobium etli]|uniref:Uncharacterized protein n=1 Tax=Rhizobium etli TaxID=29449 RepID=A0AAN1EMX7_RHIET|nr:hypothetical protein NXC12_PD00089 [Rhizobium etli]
MGQSLLQNGLFQRGKVTHDSTMHVEQGLVQPDHLAALRALRMKDGRLQSECPNVQTSATCPRPIPAEPRSKD